VVHDNTVRNNLIEGQTQELSLEFAIIVEGYIDAPPLY
jgi:hypothetical protein